MPAENSLQPPVPLAPAHDTESFDCGQVPLNEYLRRFAWTNQQANAARTYVATRSNIVVGYYTLAFGSVEPNAASARVRKGLARHPIPVMVLARLAVDEREQRRGLGKALLKDAILRTLQAAEIAGLRALIVHAKDAAAREFYVRFGFELSPLDDLHLMLLLKDMKESVR